MKPISKRFGWACLMKLPTRCRWLLLTLLLPWGWWFASPAAAQNAPELNAEEVNRAIDQAIRFLKREQRKDGTWSPPSVLAGYSISPLCALALLNAGVDPSDEHVARALDHLRKHEYQYNYEVSLQLMALCLGEPEKDLLLINRLATRLVNEQISSGRNRGAWGYGGRANSGGDPSNAQFALLALYEADRTFERYNAVSPIPRTTWEWALEYWQDTQNPVNGGWAYVPGSSVTGSMTCAGIASVIMARERLNLTTSHIQNDQVLCCGNVEREDHVARGLQWLGNNFSASTNPGDRSRWWLYYLYALERVGRLSNERLIGGHDWYRAGTAELLKHQDKITGAWRGIGVHESDEAVATSFALLFLAKGRRPTLLAKLQYGARGDDKWNRHPHDAMNLTRYVETRWKRDLSWHVVRADRATVDDLLQAPVLYISGSGSLAELMQPEFENVIREYISRGGFIFAEGCCDPNSQFDTDFRAWMARLFPDNPLTQLGPDHEVWFFEEVPPLKSMYAGQLYGVNVGCRTSVIYCQHPRNANSLSCYWELGDLRGRRDVPKKVKEEVDTALAIGINVLAYATGRQVRYKYEIPARSEPADAVAAVDRAKVIIGKLQHEGGWNAAPGALPALQRELSRRYGMLVPTDQREVDLLQPGGKLFDHHLVFLHGRNEFSFTDEQRAQLRLFVEERGGMILADAVCASEAFARSFRREMALIFPKRKLVSIPHNDPIYTTQYGGFDLSSVERVQPSQGGGNQPVRADIRQVKPELEAIVMDDGRYGVIFSPYDLSCALESKENYQCRGYTRESAARIAINVVLYSLHE